MGNFGLEVFDQQVRKYKQDTGKDVDAFKITRDGGHHVYGLRVPWTKLTLANKQDFTELFLELSVEEMESVQVTSIADLLENHGGDHPQEVLDHLRSMLGREPEPEPERQPHTYEPHEEMLRSILGRDPLSRPNETKEDFMRRMMEANESKEDFMRRMMEDRPSTSKAELVKSMLDVLDSVGDRLCPDHKARHEEMRSRIQKTLDIHTEIEGLIRGFAKSDSHAQMDKDMQKIMELIDSLRRLADEEPTE